MTILKTQTWPIQPTPHRGRLDSTYGYKRVEVRHGDITNLSNDYDMLVISAFSGGYEPTPGSLMGSLLKSQTERKDLLTHTSIFENHFPHGLVRNLKVSRLIEFFGNYLELNSQFKKSLKISSPLLPYFSQKESKYSQ